MAGGTRVLYRSSTKSHLHVYASSKAKRKAGKNACLGLEDSCVLGASLNPMDARLGIVVLASFIFNFRTQPYFRAHPTFPHQRAYTTECDPKGVPDLQPWA